LKFWEILLSSCSKNWVQTFQKLWCVTVMWDYGVCCSWKNQLWCINETDETRPDNFWFNKENCCLQKKSFNKKEIFF